MKKVMVFGTFDLLHPGHLDFFKQARKYGEYLIASIARDQVAEEIKHTKLAQNEQERLAAVQACGLVDEAVLGSLDDYYANIKTYTPDIIALGYDQQSFLTEGLESEFPDIQIVRLEPFNPEKYKSSKLRNEKNFGSNTQSSEV